MRDDVRLSLAGRMHMFIVTGWVIPLYGGYIIGSKTNYDKHILHVSLKKQNISNNCLFSNHQWGLVAFTRGPQFHWK